MRPTWLTMLLLAGCGSAGRSAGADFARPPDFAMRPSDSSTVGDLPVEVDDLSQAPPDQSVPDDLSLPPDLATPACLGQCAADAALPMCCNGQCIDTNDDPKNCGACGNDCGNLPCCGGFCTDTSTSVEHCGGCNMPCLGKNASWKCVASMCRVAGCLGKYQDCDQDPKNGCEQLGFCP